MRKTEQKNCIKCGKSFNRSVWKMKTQLFCSRECQRKDIGFKVGNTINVGSICSEKKREKIRFAHKGMKKPWVVIARLGKKLDFIPISVFKKGHKAWNKGLEWLEMRGENSPHWKGGISRDIHSTKEPQYKKWRMSVFCRDNFNCRISNNDCLGSIQAHHILRWADFPELRYQINNGITLCQAHHPRKRVEEKRLTPYFQELVSVSNVIN